MERIVELKRALAELTQAKRNLEGTAQLRSHALSHAVHDLRTPLVAIRGYIRLILEGGAGEINSKQREYLTIASENANKLAELVGSLAASGPKMHLETFDMRSLWRECFHALEPKVAAHSVRLVEKMAPEPLDVTADREMLAHVFLALVSGAVCTERDGGELHVEFSRADKDQVRVRVSYSSFGGVSPEAASDDGRARSDFGTANVSTPPTVREIIRLHGGTISIAGKLGESSTVVLTLPAVRQMLGGKAA